MRGTRAMLLAGVGALAALAGSLPAQAQSARVAVWADRTGYDDYEWIDRADAVSEAIGESPPDTSFAFETGSPWAWTLEDGTVLVVEQLPDGPHGYYFEPGSNEPFLVRDPEMSFGFIEGQVATVYGLDGGVLSRAEGRAWIDTALRGFERGKRLKRAMAQRNRWRNIGVNAWIDFSYLWYDWQDDWDYGRRRNPGWRRHHEGPRGAEHRRRWDHERQRREILRDVFKRWGDNGYRGRAPGRFTPPTPGTQPPRRWEGRNGPGRGDHRPGGRGATRPRGDLRDPRIEGGLQTDLSVNPQQGQGQGPRGGVSPRGTEPQGGVPRPMPRPGSPGSGYRPRPEPQAPVVVVPAPQAVQPAAEAPPAPVTEQPLPRPRAEPRPDRPRVREPRPERSDDDAPPRPVYTSPTPRPMRVERPSYTPPAPQRVEVAPPSYTPAPAPTRSFTPPPAPAPTRSYTPSPSPAPSYTPAPAPTRSYTPSPSPSPAPARSAPTPTPTPSVSRSSTPSSTSDND
ncbi:MAG: hypothetical protein V4574_07265 [Pseudomonadota bacterium]